MTPADFLTALESELQLRGVAFDRGDLIAFVADSWPLMTDIPHAGRLSWQCVLSHR